ncbi:MAG TPA: hypothetical protein VNW92_13325, partial [Polyangiaceae bacterium]|nr:hypothetical protein [Polyangiaceae bacterium]
SVAVWWVLPDRVRYWSEIRRVEALAPKVEEYRAAHGRYPSRQEFPVEPPMVYRPNKNGESYVLGFSAEWDFNYYYDARTKHWSFDDPKR